MEAIAPHASLGDRARQRKRLRDFGLDTVERGIEAGHLVEPRKALQQRTDRCEIVRLVQWSERYVFFQRGEHVHVDPHRLPGFEPAVDHTMADADQSLTDELGTEKSHEVIERCVVSEPDAFAP